MHPEPAAGGSARPPKASASALSLRRPGGGGKLASPRQAQGRQALPQDQYGRNIPEAESLLQARRGRVAARIDAPAAGSLREPQRGAFATIDARAARGRARAGSNAAAPTTGAAAAGRLHRPDRPDRPRGWARSFRPLFRRGTCGGCGGAIRGREIAGRVRRRRWVARPPALRRRPQSSAGRLSMASAPKFGDAPMHGAASTLSHSELGIRSLVAVCACPRFRWLAILWM